MGTDQKNAKPPVSTDKPATVQLWALTKNGNLCGVFGTKTGSIAGMRDRAKAPTAPIAEQTDGSVRLAGVQHYRAKPITVQA